MRISLLLRREPFGEILEQTLATFLESWTGQPHQVRWHAGRPNLGAMRRRGQQPWLCNIYLNAIFVPGAATEVFDPIRREFGRSVVPWRRPAQRAYVALATSRRGARWLAQAGVGISPPLPDAERLLIVPGNHKIRLLDYDQGLVYGIAKSGFPADFMRREIAARQRAAELGLPVPPLEDVAGDGTWFSERYVSGTPVTRLADRQSARDAVRDAAEALMRLLEQTLEQEPLADYVARLQGRIQALIGENHLLTGPQKRALAGSAEALAGRVGALDAGGRITTALTHGDFQPANILLNEDGVWLIDWEYAARRQAGYDALVYVLRSRFPTGLAARLRQMLEGSGAMGSPPLPLAHWPGLDWQDAARRRVYLWLFLLEELELHLEENVSPRFVRLGEGLVILWRETITSIYQ